MNRDLSREQVVDKPFHVPKDPVEARFDDQKDALAWLGRRA